jgi:butyrate kinase
VTPPTLLVINPGSTSTRLAVFRGRKALLETELKHSRREIDVFDSVVAQAAFRKKALLSVLADHGMDTSDIDVFVGRGGLLRPVPGGAFKVNGRMLRDLRAARFGEHASNLGAILAHELASKKKASAFIANPVVVDEMWDVARISGHPDLPRQSKFHALSQKAVARKVADRLGRPYTSCNFVVAHMGGGVTIGAHRKGRVVDVNNGLEGAGPFTPERTGELTLLPFYRYVTGKKLSAEEVTRLVTREGGLLAHLGTNDFKRIVERARGGHRKSRLVLDALVYGIAKSIGGMAAALSGNVDAIVLTGGLVRSRSFAGNLRKMVGFIAPVHVIVENSEMEALAFAVLDVVEGKTRAKTY